MKSKYTSICKAILRYAKKEKTDYRNLMREWIMLFEKSNIVGWNRSEFLDCMIQCKMEVKKCQEQE